MALQGAQLTMTSLGLAVPDQIEAGVHLRWAMAAGLGFPSGGFDLYRRPHLAPSPSCVKVSIAFGVSGAVSHFTSGDLTVTSTVGMLSRPYGPTGLTAIVVDGDAQLTATCARAMQSFTVTTEHPNGTVRLRALDGAVPVDSAAIAAPGGTATLTADRFTRVEITTDGEAGFFEICHALVADGADLNWGSPLASLTLPPDWATAAARIPATVQARYKPTFPKLLEVIGLLRGGARSYAAVGAPAPAPSFVVRPTQLLSLAALDPAIARMLGLAYLDATAALGTVYDYRIVGRWDVTGLDLRVQNHAWICFGVERGTPPSVSRPTGLVVHARPVGGGLMAGASSTEQAMAALAWTLPRDLRGGLDPAAAVLYHVHRQRRRPSGWTAATRLTSGQPVVVPAAAATGGLPTDFYVDGPLPAGEYRYQVEGIDLFGRTSARSAPVAVALADIVAPPPPVDVVAHAVPAAGGADIAVSWRWPAERRAQAGDAEAFRVYYQTTDIRPVLGVITTITGTTVFGGFTSVTTDLSAAGDYERFVGGYLINGGHRFPVLSIGVDGEWLALRLQNLIDADGRTVRPRAAGPVVGREALVFVDNPGALAGRFFLQVDRSDPAQWQRADRTVPGHRRRALRPDAPGCADGDRAASAGCLRPRRRRHRRPSRQRRSDRRAGDGGDRPCRRAGHADGAGPATYGRPHLCDARRLPRSVPLHADDQSERDRPALRCLSGRRRRHPCQGWPGDGG